MVLAKQCDFHTGNWKAVIWKLKDTTFSDDEVILRSLKKKNLCIYLAASGLTCSTGDL